MNKSLSTPQQEKAILIDFNNSAMELQNDLSNFEEEK
jgi:hypothetical protein